MKRCFPATYLLLVIFLLLAAALPASASTPPSYPEILFGVKNGQYTYLKITGTDPSGRPQEFAVGGAGTPIFGITRTDGKQWRDFTILVFDIVGVGRRGCVIETFNDDRQGIVVYDAAANTCIGGRGTGPSVPDMELLARSMQAEAGSLLVDAAGLAYDAPACAKGLVQLIASKSLNKDVIVGCAGASAAVINLVLTPLDKMMSDTKEGWRYGLRTFSFESHNYPAYFVRHYNFLGEVTTVTSDLARRDATWHAVRGLADKTCISLESVNYPGYYLRHESFRLRLARCVDSSLYRADATFCPRRGLAFATDVSFESLNYPGYFIRHRDFHLYLEKGSSDLFKEDATFKVVAPLGW